MIKLNINSKILLWIVSIFTILNLGDIITAMFILDGESNPIYLLTGSVLALWLFKLFLVLLTFYVYYKNKYPTKFTLFSFIYVLTIGCLMLMFGITSNVIGMMQPEVVATASTMTTAAKVSYYGYVVTFLMIIPYLISMLSFKI